MKTITAICLLALLLCGCATTSLDRTSLQHHVDQLADNGAGFDTPAARAAYTKLEQQGTNAFSVLIANIDDPKPACQCLQRQTVGRTTVGYVCFEIVRWQVEKYCMPMPGKGGYGYLPYANLADWWRQNEGKSLHMLQIQAVEWSIHKM